MEIVSAKDILNANGQIAQLNRRQFETAGVVALNLMGSPGSGKTTLLEALLPRMPCRSRTLVIEGDLATPRDAERIEKLGVRAIQINTDGGCHLDARMIATVLGGIALEDYDLMVIENIGNLVCTAGFDLGEQGRIVVLSIPEGDDKVEKYPPIFQGADVVLLSKLDLLPHAPFDLEKVESQLARLAPGSWVHRVSARSGEGLDEIAQWLIQRLDRRPTNSDGNQVL